MKKQFKTIFTILFLLFTFVSPVYANDDIQIVSEFDGLSGAGKYLGEDYINNYALDVEEMGILDAVPASLFAMANIVFDLLQNMGRAAVSFFYWAVTFNLSDQLPPGMIDGVQQGLVDGFFTPLFPLAFCGVAFLLASRLASRDYSGLTGELIKTVSILAISGLITTHSATALGVISDVTSVVSTSTLVAMNGGEETERFAANASGILWETLVHKPWMSLEFMGGEIDEALADDILYEKINSEGRIDLVNDNLSNNYFSKEVSGQRAGRAILYLLVSLPKCLLFMGLSGMTIPLQAITIIFIFFAPVILLLSLVPGFGGTKLISMWGKKILEIQLMTLFLMMLLGFSCKLSITLTEYFAEKGWLIASLLEIVCFATLIIMRKHIFGLFKFGAAAVGDTRHKYRGFDKVNSMYDGVYDGTGSIIRGMPTTAQRFGQFAMNTIIAERAAESSYLQKYDNDSNPPVTVKRPSTTDKTKAELAAEAAEAKAKETELALAAKREAEAVQRPRPYLYPPKAEEASETSTSIVRSVASGTAGQTLNVQQQPEQSINVVRPEFSSKRPKATASSPPVTTVLEKATAAAASDPGRTSRRTIANDSSGVPYVIADAAAAEQPATVVERPVSTVDHSTTATSAAAPIETGSGNTLKTTSSGSSETVTRTHMSTGIETGTAETVSRASSGSSKVSGQAKPKHSNIEDSSATVSAAHNVAETSGETATQTINRIVQADVQRELEVPGNTATRPKSSSASAQTNNINAAGRTPAQAAHVSQQTHQQPVKKGKGSGQRQPVQHSATATVGRDKAESTTATLNKVVQGEALKSLEVPENTAARPKSSSAATTKAESTTAELNKVVQGDALKSLDVPGNTATRPESSSAAAQVNNISAAGQAPAQAAHVPPQAQQSPLKQGGSQQQPLQHNTAATVGQTKPESTTATLNKVVQGDALKSLDVPGNTAARPELSSSTSAAASKPKSSDKSGSAANNNINNHTNSIPVGRGSTPVSISNNNIDIPAETSNPISRPESAALNTVSQSNSTDSTIQVESGVHDLKQSTDSSGATLSTTNIQAPEILGSPAIVSPVSPTPGATAKQPEQKSPAKEKLPEALERTGNTPVSMEMNAVYIDGSSTEVKKKSLSEQSSSEKKDEKKAKATKEPPRQRQTQAKIPPATKEIPTARQKPATQLPDAHTQPMQIQVGKDSAAPEVKRPSTTDKRAATKKKPQQQPASEKRKN